MDFAKMLQPLTGSANWPTWKRRVRDLIDNQEGALDVIDGRFAKPEPEREEATPTETRKIQLFRKANCYAKSVLTATVTEDIYSKVMEKDTARAVWLALHQLFEATTEDQLFKVGMDFFQYSWSHSEDAAANAAKLRRLWNELNAGLLAQGEAAMPELFVIFKLLQVLPHAYQPFKTNWLMKEVKDKRSENFVLQLCSFERNVIQEGHSESQEAFSSESKHKQQMAKSTTSRQVKKSDVCNYCKKKGHWVRNCKKWIADGRPPRSSSQKNAGGQSQPSPAATTMLSAVSSIAFQQSEQDPESWWIDNGATRHVTNTMDYFATYTPFVSQHSIRAAGQEVLNAKGKGTIYVKAKVNASEEVLLLTDVWYVPNVNRNLFSVLASQDKQTSSVFKSTVTDCWLSVGGRVVLHGSRSTRGTLYKADVKPIKKAAQACITEEVNQESACFVHIPKERRKKLDKKAVRGYLIGYDGDERYRVWIPDQNKVELSRDVTFHEKTGNYANREATASSDKADDYSKQGKMIPATSDAVKPQQLESRRDESEEERPLSRSSRSSSSNFSSGTEIIEPSASPPPSPSTTDSASPETSTRQLRNREKLRKPDRYGMNVTEFNDFGECSEQEMFILQQSNPDVPQTFEDAITSKNRQEWRIAMNQEFQSLQDNRTWDLVDLPEGAKVIPCKWVYRVKTLPDGSISKFKARLVVKGYAQKEGVDFSQTFSPVARLETVRTVLSIAAQERMTLSQFDVSSAFLYGDLTETVFMSQPEGYKDGTGRVCKLQKSLYGLKQAPRCWNKRFSDYLLKQDFKVSLADPCLYIRSQGENKLYIVLYVDDGLVAASSSAEAERFLQELAAEFKITTGPASYFLGLEIVTDQDGSIRVHQKSYIKQVLQRFNLDGCKSVSTPMLKEPREHQQKPEDSKEIAFPYRQAVGALMYLMVGTRPDIAYSVSVLSRTLDNPSVKDIICVKRVFRFLAGTREVGLLYLSEPHRKLECFSDSDFGGCSKTGRSTSGVVIMNAGGAISWLSQRQGAVATSTTEAEIIAASEATKELIWISRLLTELTNRRLVPILQVDNSAAVKLARNPEFHRRTKHIDIKNFFIREKIQEGVMDVSQIPTERQVADLMTKPLQRTRFKVLSSCLGLSD